VTRLYSDAARLLDQRFDRLLRISGGMLTRGKSLFLVVANDLGAALSRDFDESSAGLLRRLAPSR